jgi:hypothetical protein
MTDTPEWDARLRHVMNTVWDPIGRCPEDEYDTYAKEVRSLILSGASDESIREYLRFSHAVTIGLNEPSRDHLDRTITAIRALGPVSNELPK